MGYRDLIRDRVELGARIEIVKRGQGDNRYSPPRHPSTPGMRAVGLDHPPRTPEPPVGPPEVGTIVDVSDHHVEVKWDSGELATLVRGVDRWRVVGHERAGETRGAFPKWFLGTADPEKLSARVEFQGYDGQFRPTARDRVTDAFGHSVALAIGIGVLILIGYVVADWLGWISALFD